MSTVKTKRARDIMRREVLRLSPDDSIESALTMFEDARISGAPVMTADGRLVGVLTLADIARTDHLDGDHIDAREDARRGMRDEPEDAEPGEAFFLREDYDPEVLGQRRVSDWMTEQVITVAADTPVPEVCQTMVDNSIHRVFVVDGKHLVGVVSSFDVIRTIAKGH